MYTSFYNQSERGGGFGGTASHRTTNKTNNKAAIIKNLSYGDANSSTDAILFLNQKIHNDKLIVSQRHYYYSLCRYVGYKDCHFHKLHCIS